MIEFPFFSMQQLNLDWVIEKIKGMLSFLPDDGTAGQILRRTTDGAEWSDEETGGGAVDSVNGQTGTVVLGADDILMNDNSSVEDTVDDLKSAITYVTPEMYGAKGDGVTDDTTYVQQAFDSGKTVLLDGKYKITSPLRLLCSPQSVKSVKLTGTLIFDNAFLWVFGYNVSLFGGGKITGTAPEALVVLGGLADKQDVSCINATIDNVFILGTQGASACGGVIIRNYYLGSYGAYCNAIHNVYCEDTTFAVKLIGDANANNISDINLTSYDNDNIIAMFVFEGLTYNGATYAPLENIVRSSFYYRGLNTPMVLVKSNVGTAFRYNVFDSLACEQQGNTTDTVFISVEQGATPTKNLFINISANTYGGAFKSTVGTLLFDNNNTFIGDTFNYQQNLSTKAVSIDNLFTMKSTRKVKKVFTGTTAENTTVKLFTANGVSPIWGDPKSQGAMIRVSIVENRNGAPLLQHAENITLFVGNNSMSISEQQANSRFSVDGYSLNYKTGNNGTGFTDVRITYEVNILSYARGADYLLTDTFGG